MYITQQSIENISHIEEELQITGEINKGGKLD